MEYFNLNRLRHFYKVAEEGSFTKASQKLHIQQPALSKTIKALEEDLGVKLFDKIGRGIKLTPKGEGVYEHCHKIFDHINALSDFAKEENVLLNKTLHIVSDDAISALVLPHALKSMQFKEKALRPVIATGLATDLMTKLSNKKAEMGFFFYTPKFNKEIVSLSAFPVDFKLVVAKKFLKSPNTLSSFIGSREINDTSNTKFPTIKKMKKIWPETKSTLSCNSFLTHKELVLNGLGVSLLPSFLVQKEIREGTLATLMNEERFTYDLKILVRSENKDSALLNEICKRMKSSLESL